MWEKNIISAIVHLDKTTPHVHLTYIPVVQATNKKGEEIKKINYSDFWKGFNSYGKLQDNFYDHRPYEKARVWPKKRGKERGSGRKTRAYEC